MSKMTIRCIEVQSGNIVFGMHEQIIKFYDISKIDDLNNTICTYVGEVFSASITCRYTNLANAIVELLYHIKKHISYEQYDDIEILLDIANKEIICTFDIPNENITCDDAMLSQYLESIDRLPILAEYGFLSNLPPYF